MELTEVVRGFGGQARLAKALGVDKSYLNRVMKNRRPLGPALAVRIYRATGHKLGPIAEASPKQIEAIEAVALRREAA